jgi:ribosomal protein S6
MEEENIGTEADSESKIYEIGYHVVPSVPEDKLGAEVTSLKDVLEKNGATIISEELPKMRTLSYEMRKESAGKYQKYTSAYFGWVKFEVPASQILEIEKAFKVSPVVLRYLLIKTVRENTMTVPRIPSYRKGNGGEAPKFEEKKSEDQAEKPPVLEAELDKAIDAAIAE